MGNTICGKREKTSDDLILKICEALENGQPRQQIADELNVSISTVYRYGKEFDLLGTKKTKSKKKATTTRKKKEKKVANQKPAVTRGGGKINGEARAS